MNFTVSFRKPTLNVGYRAVHCARCPRLSLDMREAYLVSVIVHIVFCFLSLILFPHVNSEGGGAVLSPGLSLLPKARALWLGLGVQARRERGHCPGLCEL